MNESLLIALLQADADGDERAVADILKLAHDPAALQAAVQTEQKKGGDNEFADGTSLSSLFQGPVP